MNPDQLLKSLFDEAVQAVRPAECLPGYLPPQPKGSTVVVGAGKAAASMASVLEQNWGGPLSGLVVTRYGHGLNCERIEVIEAAHPVPDEEGNRAAHRILSSVQGLEKDDLVICLISGGGSSLLSLPAPGITLKDKQAVNKALLRSGATISDMNCVRKHLSAIKGGRLAVAAMPAQLVTLMISDVPGDDPCVIASGPTIADPTTFEDALNILSKYDICEPQVVLEHLRAGIDETPKPGSACFKRSESHIIATTQDALQAAAAVAKQQGITPHILGDLQGESRDVALVHGGIARQVARYQQPFSVPCVILSGGETTVTVRGTGRGGRNVEFLLALAVELDGLPGVYAIACDTDGIDGTEDNAGALLRPDSMRKATAIGANAIDALANNDGYGFFKSIEDLVVSGPTLTNVNDFRAILITAEALPC